jgi:hypothetical protein
MSDLNVEILIKKFIPDYGTQGILASLQQIYVIFLVSVPLSLLLYLMFSKYRHYILVDLGHHKWLIK